MWNGTTCGKVLHVESIPGDLNKHIFTHGIVVISSKNFRFPPSSVPSVRCISVSAFQYHSCGALYFTFSLSESLSQCTLFHFSSVSALYFIFSQSVLLSVDSLSVSLSQCTVLQYCTVFIPSSINFLSAINRIIKEAHLNFNIKFSKNMSLVHIHYVTSAHTLCH
jgi:hypothetical protein